MVEPEKVYTPAYFSQNTEIVNLQSATGQNLESTAENQKAEPLKATISKFDPSESQEKASFMVESRKMSKVRQIGSAMLTHKRAKSSLGFQQKTNQETTL